MQVFADDQPASNGRTLHAARPKRYGPFQKNCNTLRLLRGGKGDRPLLPERPAGCCGTKGVCSLFLSVRNQGTTFADVKR